MVNRGGKGKGGRDSSSWRSDDKKRFVRKGSSEKSPKESVPAPAINTGVENRIVNSNLSLPWTPPALSQETQQVIDRLGQSITSSAWVPMIDLSDSSSSAGSVFGGSRVFIKPGVELPVCLGCKQAMSSVCQIERESLLHPFQGKGLVQVFACAPCAKNPEMKPKAACWASVIDPKDNVEVREVHPGRKSKRVVKWLPRKDFMHPQEAEEVVGHPLSAAEWAALGQAQIRGDKIGGCVPWLKRINDLKLKCKVCDVPQRLLLTVDSGDNATSFEWGKDGCLMVFECPAHSEQVTAIIMST